MSAQLALETLELQAGEGMCKKKIYDRGRSFVALDADACAAVHVADN